ncbi:hypothetical protein CEXT_750411 [Caerostris extrusa]|uniref:Uncharacterized protein n=1 Tax=Caerostris extrusa TaxID=172846 RepID=A0AAV4TMW0_CAEEX|nr:hypothetical protein CEXT_750411 [Caerostris extrusa]
MSPAFPVAPKFNYAFDGVVFSARRTEGCEVISLALNGGLCRPPEALPADSYLACSGERDSTFDDCILVDTFCLKVTLVLRFMY